MSRATWNVDVTDFNTPSNMNFTFGAKFDNTSIEVLEKCNCNVRWLIFRVDNIWYVMEQKKAKTHWVEKWTKQMNSDKKEAKNYAEQEAVKLTTMSRVTKFRVVDINANQVIGYEQIEDRDWCHQWVDDENWWAGVFNSEILRDGFYIIKREQYTGHKDRHGIEIYEGDIIRRYNYVYLVVWCDETSRLGYTCVGRYARGQEGEIEAIQSELSPFNFSDDTETVNEVIGNIHQTPNS